MAIVLQKNGSYIEKINGNCICLSETAGNGGLDYLTIAETTSGCAVLIKEGS